MELKEGMIIYRESRISDNLYKGEIIRTTKTQAIAKLSNNCEYRFDKEQKNDYFFEKGNNNYLQDYYRISTPELDERYYKQMLVNKYSKIVKEELTIDQLKRIISIANENHIADVGKRV
jgi:hypothetical protein